MGMMNESPIYSKEQKEGKAIFLQDSPDTSCTFVQVRKRLEKYPDDPKRKMG